MLHDLDLVVDRGQLESHWQILQYQRAAGHVRVLRQEAAEIVAFVAAYVDQNRAAQVGAVQKRFGVEELGPWDLVVGPTRHPLAKGGLVGRVGRHSGPEIELFGCPIAVGGVVVVQRLPVRCLLQEAGHIIVSPVVRPIQISTLLPGNFMSHQRTHQACGWIKPGPPRKSENLLGLYRSSPTSSIIPTDVRNRQSRPIGLCRVF